MHYTHIPNLAADRGLANFPHLPAAAQRRPAASVLSKSELRRIVAELLG